MTQRARSFGSVAERYERFRPGYPESLVDAVLDYAGEPVATAIEIGAGTGKATRAFAARGIEVVATDPGAQMLAELHRRVPQVATIQASLETVQLEPPRTFDLVFAAASLHWTDPATRWPRIASLLRPGGTLACFGGPIHLADPDIAGCVRVAREAYVPTDDIPSPDGTSPGSQMHWPGTELEQSELFTDVREQRIERRWTMAREDYLGHLETVSAYAILPVDDRRKVLELIAAALPDSVDVNGDPTLHPASAERTMLGHRSSWSERTSSGGTTVR